MKSEFTGDILSVRSVEDCIRATRKYTKGAFTTKVVHPVQDSRVPVKSPVLSEHYEVYPDLEIGWNMKATDAWAWVWGDVTRIDVKFIYDYRDNAAKMTVYGGRDAVGELASGIPNLSQALSGLFCDDSTLTSNGYGTKRKPQGIASAVSKV